MDATPPAPPLDAVRHGLRFAFGTLTVLPVGPPPRWDRRTARAGMLCAPVAGCVVGLCAAGAGWVLWLLGFGPFLTALGTVAVPVLLSRALHLDGLADVADGLGSGRPAEGALAVMKRSDIGPFGVVALLLTLLAQLGALTELYGAGQRYGLAAAVLCGLVSRTALTLGCRARVPAARPDGLGALVAGSVPQPAAYGAALTTALLATVLAGPVGGCAAVLGLAAAEVLLARCRRRLGGVTGDVLGALAETAGTAALLVATLGTG
ncbi:adenosylcobinamide-GDP ribazoletransferase [Streptomyces harbinensis]|uniref:Adenosylcobinamide-GDP ribazoletransferase n=1 Tax=Streptomyces harbinensis TaxID=1176198 RepID=A0A1I6RTC6_9ACTN|nr:adenosylcobinamide-GDP ribazoletransferase [Streptomyces harbinensis]QKV68436.1 adenosylcobinamide-GDP ribazoletransferase [Streptomyces harbinensis]SFS67965.1 adenosylcobinamide-GDP ribazoletransferase [Streptomyces harbinensis]